MRISDWSSDVCSSDLRGVFAKAMASNEIRLIGQTNAAFLLQHPQRRNGVRHDRWLGILSESQIAVWSFTQNTEEMLAQRIINFLKYLPCGRTGFCKRLAHPHGLNALPWTNKHGRATR